MFEQLGSRFAARAFAVIARPMKDFLARGNADVGGQALLERASFFATRLPPLCAPVGSGARKSSVDQYRYCFGTILLCGWCRFHVYFSYSISAKARPRLEPGAAFVHVNIKILTTDRTGGILCARTR